jgi:hypothetical protein
VLLVILAVAVGRRRRRRALVLASVAPPESEPVAGPEPDRVGPYATLAADPDAAPAAPTERPPDMEGGAPL